jgi:hypothetical protein
VPVAKGNCFPFICSGGGEDPRSYTNYAFSVPNPITGPASYDTKYDDGVDPLAGTWTLVPSASAIDWHMLIPTYRETVDVFGRDLSWTEAFGNDLADNFPIPGADDPESGDLPVDGVAGDVPGGAALPTAGGPSGNTLTAGVYTSPGGADSGSGGVTGFGTGVSSVPAAGAGRPRQAIPQSGFLVLPRPGY